MTTNSQSEQIDPPAESQQRRERRRKRIVPVIVTGVLASVYALWTPSIWEATQTVTIRVDNPEHAKKPGAPSTLEQLKFAADTLHAVVADQNTLSAALARFSKSAPAAQLEGTRQEQIETLRSAIDLSSPQETDTVNKEVYYLGVKYPSRERATALSIALGEEIEARCQTVLEQQRNTKVEQLTKDEALATSQLQAASQQLAQFEETADADVIELRRQRENPAAANELPHKVAYLENRVRQLEQTKVDSQDRSKLLHDLVQNPADLVAAPNTLLESQPALRSLKDKLADAQLRLAVLRNTMSDEHPQVVTAVANEAAIREQIDDEITSAIKLADLDPAQFDEQIASLKKELREARERMQRLASVRAEFARLSDEVEGRTVALQEAQTRLQEARVHEASVRSPCSIRMWEPQHPDVASIGLSKLGIVLAGLIVGGLISAGRYLLTRPIAATEVPPVAAAPEPFDRSGLPDIGVEYDAAGEDEPAFKQFLRKALSTRF